MYKVAEILVMVVVVVAVVDVAFLSQYPIELDCSQLSSLSSSLSDLPLSETLETFAAAGFESLSSLLSLTFGSMGNSSCLSERVSLKTNPIFSIVSKRKKRNPTLYSDPCHRLPVPAVSCKRNQSSRG